MVELSYIRVWWLHSSPDDPVELWSELDPYRYEVRKVEIWADGHVGYASANREFGGTALGTEAVPSLEEIAADPEFKPEVVSRSDFEERWRTSAMSNR